MILPFSTTLYTIEDNKEGSVNYLGVGEYVQYWTDKGYYERNGIRFNLKNQDHTVTS